MYDRLVCILVSFFALNVNRVNALSALLWSDSGRCFVYFETSSKNLTIGLIWLFVSTNGNQPPWQLIIENSMAMTLTNVTKSNFSVDHWLSSHGVSFESDKFCMNYHISTFDQKLHTIWCNYRLYVTWNRSTNRLESGRR